MSYKGSTVYCFRKVEGSEANKPLYVHMNRPTKNFYLKKNEWGNLKGAITYPALKAFHIVYPGVIEKNYKVGQYVNPTKLLRQHLALKEEGISNEN